MAGSTLELTREQPAETSKGHGTAALGPGGTSDSGSDPQGPGLANDAGLHLDTGTTSDLELGRGAGHDVGDANLDGDTDETGTGELATAGRDDDVGQAQDVAPDRIIGSELPMPADALDRLMLDDDRTEDPEEHASNANDARK